jgi:hypothetical protein
MLSDYEVINLTITTTDTHKGRVMSGREGYWGIFLLGAIERGASEMARADLTKGPQLTQPSMGRRLASNNETTGRAQHGLEKMEEFEQNMRQGH